MVVRRLEDGTTETFARLETVGQGGALLWCDEPIPESEETELIICLAGGVIRVRARVLYHLPGDDGVGVGVEFVEVPAKSGDLLHGLVSPPPPGEHRD